jgi:DNA-binding HxlR family transcriptional regulator
MSTYRQYCPVARAAEIVSERWNLLIIRNLLFGATTFSSIAQGVPAMSRSMLIKRLRELEANGLLTSTPKANGHGSEYRLTEAGAGLAEVVTAMGKWAEDWVEVLPQHADPGFALWAWCQVQLNREALPSGRVVVSFEFPDQPAGNRFFWLLVEHGNAELCATDPGDEPAVRVRAQSGPFVDWHRGVLPWARACADGSITLTGDPDLIAQLDSWNTLVPQLA